MTSRPLLSALSALALVALVALVAGCGDGGSGDSSKSKRDNAASVSVPRAPGKAEQPPQGKGSKDPDDVNGDGYRDLLVPAYTSRDADTRDHEERIAVVYGSADGLNPVTRTVHGAKDLGLPEPPDDTSAPRGLSTENVVLADLDGDGFSDVVTPVAGAQASGGNVSGNRVLPHITWGGPQGPRTGDHATPLPLPSEAGDLGLESVERGDFDGDGHHDLAGLSQDESGLVVMYGPFTRSGAPARSDSLPWTDGTLIADDIDPSGEHRATSLLVQATNDGEQSTNTLHRATTGDGLATRGEKLRRGNAHAFGDFDGDRKRDLAVGDDGARNDEPGYETESPQVDGTLTIYPGNGTKPVHHQLPKAPKGAETGYGPGGFTAADPDGDGRDGILVATYEGATLIDGDQRVVVRRDVPARVDGEKIPGKRRHSRPAGAADFDQDGKDELIMHWAADGLFHLYGEVPTHWWITKGTSATDTTSFATTSFATGS
ncbi:hypothetical protein [Streptomyces sp. NPDC005438]|uniref:hypothetical protein n=1 Tax=Streptomyces sp. NPDC005438 TaxID=3156880 RepID=UPI0033B97776